MGKFWIGTGFDLVKHAFCRRLGEVRTSMRPAFCSSPTESFRFGTRLGEDERFALATGRRGRAFKLVNQPDGIYLYGSNIKKVYQSTIFCIPSLHPEIYNANLFKVNGFYVWSSPYNFLRISTLKKKLSENINNTMPITSRQGWSAV